MKKPIYVAIIVTLVKNLSIKKYIKNLIFFLYFLKKYLKKKLKKKMLNESKKYKDFNNSNCGKLYHINTLNGLLTGKFKGFIDERANIVKTYPSYIGALKFEIPNNKSSPDDLHGNILYVSELMLNQNLIKLTETGSFKHVCNKCNKSFKGQSGLWYHNKHSHNEDNSDKLNQKYYKMPKYWPFLKKANDDNEDKIDINKLNNSALIKLYTKSEFCWNTLKDKKKARNDYKEWVYRWRSSKDGKKIQSIFKKYQQTFKNKLKQSSKITDYQYHLHYNAVIIQKIMLKNKKLIKL